jgi:hypothetical protein
VVERQPMSERRWVWTKGQIGCRLEPVLPEDCREVFAEELERLAALVREHGAVGTFNRTWDYGHDYRLSRRRETWDFRAPDGMHIRMEKR